MARDSKSAQAFDPGIFINYLCVPSNHGTILKHHFASKHIVITRKRQYIVAKVEAERRRWVVLEIYSDGSTNSRRPNAELSNILPCDYRRFQLSEQEGNFKRLLLGLRKT